MTHNLNSTSGYTKLNIQQPNMQNNKSLPIPMPSINLPPTSMGGLVAAARRIAPTVKTPLATRMVNLRPKRLLVASLTIENMAAEAIGMLTTASRQTEFNEKSN